MDHYTSRNVQHRIVAKNHTSLLLQHAYATLAAEMAEKALKLEGGERRAVLLKEVRQSDAHSFTLLAARHNGPNNLLLTRRETLDVIGLVEGVIEKDALGNHLVLLAMG